MISCRLHARRGLLYQIPAAEKFFEDAGYNGEKKPGDLNDPRSTIMRRHRRGDLVAVCIMTVIAGVTGPLPTEVWAAKNDSNFRTAFFLTTRSVAFLLR